MVKKKAKPPQVPTPWRNRIVGHDLVEPSTLKANPQNWRIHPGNQRSAVSGVLDEVGWVQQVMVSSRTGNIVDGHLRVELAEKAGEKVPICFVDLDEVEEAKILAALDPLSSMAITDSDALATLLAGMETNRPLDALLRSLVDQADVTALTDVPTVEGKSPYSGLVGTPTRSQIKAVLYCEQIALFEKALKLTGETNRGAALMIICREYVEDQERQHDAGAKDKPAQKSAA